MDYKEKYEELVEAARTVVDGNPGLCKIDEGFERLSKLLPEKESNDEKIRKAIGAAICGTTAETILEANGVKLVDALDYLEKQKEHVSDNFDDVWTTEDCAEIIEAGEKLSPRFKELLKEVCHAWYDKGIELEKQKEQQPNAHDEWFEGNKPNDNFVAYIRKDALLEWAKEKKKQLLEMESANDEPFDVAAGIDVGLNMLIGKLNSM